MKHWFEDDGEEHDNRAARRDRLLIATSLLLIALIALAPFLL